MRPSLERCSSASVKLSPLVPFQSFPVIENLLYDGPCLHFGLQSHSCVRWASRWQSIEDVSLLGQGRQDVTAKSRLGLPPVKKHMRDVGVTRKKVEKSLATSFVIDASRLPGLTQA
jgi:hypothetical protein